MTISSAVFSTIDITEAVVSQKYFVAVNYVSIGRFAVAIGSEITGYLKVRDVKRIKQMYEDIKRNTFTETDNNIYNMIGDGMDIGKELGTRHRAAVGISEVSDSLTIIVSEETGAVSLAKDGNLYKHLKKEELLEKLKQLKIDEENNTDVFKKWKDLLRNEKSEK